MCQDHSVILHMTPPDLQHQFHFGHYPQITRGDHNNGSLRLPASSSIHFACPKVAVKVANGDHLTAEHCPLQRQASRQVPKSLCHDHRDATTIVLS